MYLKLSFMCFLICCLVGNACSCLCDHYPWGEWTTCTKTCNHGAQVRSRKLVFNKYYWDNNCNVMCEKQQTQSCNDQSCPIDCRPGEFGPWSDCEPCLQKQYRIRSTVRPAQFGGESCKLQLSDQIPESRPCTPTTQCKIQEADCTEKFKCLSGRCIDLNLQCNGDDDCGDHSDERECPKQTKKRRILQNVPGAQLLGIGYNYLSGQSRGDIFGNSFYGGRRTIIYDDQTTSSQRSYRLPYNVESFTFKVTDEKDDVVTDFYESPMDFASDKKNEGILITETSDSVGIPLLAHLQTDWRYSSSSSFQEAIRSSYKKVSKYIRIHKVISVSEFAMRKDNLWLSNGFLKDLNRLPLEYNYPLYSRIFDDYGTHYISKGKLGGSYDLLYQYSAEDLKNSGLTQEESKTCLSIETKITLYFIFTWSDLKEKCTKNQMTETYEGSMVKSSEKSFSFVKGGRAKFSNKLAYEKGGEAPDSKAYEEWKRSVADNPVIVDFELKPITDLITGFPCAATKRRNFLKAFQEYQARFDPCQCTPCQNNAKTVLVGSECLCVCQPGTYGESCEKRSPDFQSDAVDGSWNCWSSWSDCDASSVRRRNRQCNNPAPSKGGKPCDGPHTQEDQCRNVINDNQASCIDEEQDKKEDSTEIPKPDRGCPKPEPPENALLVNEKKQYNIDEEAEITCFSDFRLQGHRFIKCLPDGTWKKEDVKCV